MLFFLISACGFQPIYSQKFVLATDDVLASIFINPIGGEFGNKLHVQLKESLNPSKKSTPIRYKLQIKLPSMLSTSVIISNSQTVNYTSIIKVEYTLIDNQNNQEITKGILTSSDSYYTSASEFAIFSSNQAAIENNLKKISEDLKNKLIAFLSRNNLK
ncbi:MAG: hypothetical protein AB8U25_01765 [Rickettsiales endosymbiont of Dermacentor nuttalli]